MKTFLAAVFALAVLAGCSSEPSKPSQTEKPQPKPPDMLAGRSAVQKAYIQARGWAPDAKPYHLESQITSDAKGRDGKADVWRSSFASDSRRTTKTFTWSGTNAADAPERGMMPGTEDSYNPTNSTTQVFDIAFLKVDSDQALATAAKHGGDKILEKNPDLPVMFVLDWSRVTNELIWHVIYGANRDEAKLRVAINASTGEFIRVEK